MFNLNKFAKEWFGTLIDMKKAISTNSGISVSSSTSISRETEPKNEKAVLDEEIDLSHQEKESPKMTEEIEDNVFSYWENVGWYAAEQYLFDMGFSYEEIDLMRDQWSDGKSLYPYDE